MSPPPSITNRDQNFKMHPQRRQRQPCWLLLLALFCVASIVSSRLRFIAPVQFLSYIAGGRSGVEKINSSRNNESFSLENFKSDDQRNQSHQEPLRQSRPLLKISKAANKLEDDNSQTTALESSTSTGFSFLSELAESSITLTGVWGKSSPCFQLNSKDWLQGPRHGNAQVPDDWLHTSMTPASQLFLPTNNDSSGSSSSYTFDQLLNQTLCHEHSRFRRGNGDQNNRWCRGKTREEQVHYWRFQLLYLAIHTYLHAPAFDEYQERVQCGLFNLSPTTSTSTTNPLSTSAPIMGNFDYECPKAKFVVVVVETMGMGATFRNGVIPSIYIALAVRRIPIFISSRQLQFWQPDQQPTAQHSDHFNESFPLASCAREDLQCVFLPLSPCVLTWNDVATATILSDLDNRQLKQMGTYRNASHVQERVIIHHANLIPLRPRLGIHDKIREWAYETIRDIVVTDTSSVDEDDAVTNNHTVENQTTYKAPNHTVRQNCDDRTVMTEAMNHYRERYQDNTDYRHTYRTFSSALFYLLRPNAQARIQMAKQLQGTMMMNGKTMKVPDKTSTSVQRQYFGLPIRASDKCEQESTCLSFAHYMELMRELWQQHGLPDHRGTILLTSEDSRVLPLRLAYTQNASFPFDIWVNHADAQPDSGLPQLFRENADAIMISSLTALQIQLQASYIVANCCSNFHSLLRSLVGEGCGRDPNVTFECLDQSKNPKYRICCAWTVDSACDQIIQEHEVSMNRTRHAKEH